MSPRPPERVGRTAVAVAGAFFVVHLIVLWRSSAVVNLEEADWGNLGAAWLDGMAWDPLAFQELDRQGMVQLMGPFKGLLYALFGPSFFTLKSASIVFAAATAGLMYAVARRTAPGAPRLETALLCAVPAPLVSIAAMNAYGPASPFGAAFFFFGCLLLLDSDRWARVVAAGALAALGVWAGTAFVLFLPPLAWLAWRRRGPGAALVFGACTAPGWSWVARNLDTGLSANAGADTLFGLSGISGFLPPGVGDLAWHPLGVGLMYWPGLGAQPSTRPDPDFLAGGLVLSPLILLGLLAWWRRRTPGSEAVVLGLFAWAFALAISGYEELAGGWRVDPQMPGGLRYCWPWPLLWTLAAILGAATLRHGRWALRVLLAVYVVGWGVQVVHDEQPTPWHTIAGYQSVRIRTRTWPPALVEGIAIDRQNRHAFWIGQTLPLRSMPRTWRQLDGSLRDLPLHEGAWDEALRGFGLSAARGRCSDSPARCIPPDTPPEARARIWEGIGMGHGCEDPREVLQQAGARWADQVWWGLGRVELLCRGEWERRNRRAPPAYTAGWEAGWSYDVAAPGHREVDEARLKRLRLYNFRWVQGPDF